MPPKKVITKPAAKPAASKTPVRATVVKPVQKKPVGAAGGAKKPVAAPTTKGKGPPPGKVVEKKKPEKKWTPQDDAARKIQTEIRRFLAKKQLEKRRKKKEEYEHMMENLEKEAFAKLVKMEQEQAEKEHQKEEEERRRKREEAKRKKRMLEAAFDGENDEIMTILKEVKTLDDNNGIGNDIIGTALRNKHIMNMIDCRDANDNTPLSEAASGGHADTITFLLERGADPNSQGQFLRSPLYRAAFAAHLEACQILLQHGADPRIYAADGQTPQHIASQSSVAELLADWDIEQTESLLVKLENDKEKRKEEDRKRREAEMSKSEEQIKEAEKDYNAKQNVILKLTQELNKRIEEHDTAVASGFDRPEVTLQSIHDAESDLDLGRIDHEKARDKLAALRLQYREQERGSAAAGEDDLPGLKVTIRELDDVLMRDIGNRIKDAGRWPLIIDTSGQAATFLRYRDTNFVAALSPANMEPQKLRLATLGALRYGKPLVLDMMQVDMFDNCSVMFNNIQPGLMDAIMDKSVLTEQVYVKLIKDSDGPDYNKNNFNDFFLKNFKFIIITQNPYPPVELMERTYPIRIHVPT